jgi:hypothetical protein
MEARNAKGRPSRGQPSNRAEPRQSSKRNKKTTPEGTPRQLMVADLKRSGLTAADAKKAKYNPLTARETKELTGSYAASYLIPYHDVNGKLTKYWRVRYTEKVKGPFGAAKKKPRRYTGPPGELPRFYFPASVDWKAFAQDTDETVMITEGEKKAEKACDAQLPCFSVPGVWAWRSKKQGVAAIPDFKMIKWKGRKVYLCFDNDLMTKPDVIGALNALARELTGRGASVWIKYLPKGPGKIGLDDYLKKRSAESFLKLKEEEFKESAELWKLSEEIAAVNDPNAVWEFAARRFLRSHQDFKNRYGDRIIRKLKANGDGFKEVSAIEEWQKWKHKRRYKTITYRPGEDEIVDDCINTWPGWGCEPKKGDVKPVIELLAFVFKDEPDMLAHFLQWLAYPLQFPGGKNMTAYLFHSLHQGVGKSFIGYIMKRIYGDNFVAVDNEVMQGNFNGWITNKQFILGEEIAGTRARGTADLMKNMVTREQIHVNEKYQPAFDIEDCANYLLTSNHVDAMHVEDTDRRLNIIETKGSPKPQVFYGRVGRWLKKGGASHWFYYLLNEIDLSNYNPHAHAPISAAKRRMIDISKSDLDMFARDVLDNPDAVLRSDNTICEGDLYEADAIHSFAQRYCDRPGVTQRASTKALSRAGIECHEIRFNNKTHRLWPLRNTEAWMNRPNVKWVEHYNKHTPMQKF